MKVKSLEKQVASHSKSLDDARARMVAADEDLERLRQQHRRSPEGSLRQELFRLGAAKAEAEAKASGRWPAQACWVVFECLFVCYLHSQLGARSERHKGKCILS